MSAYGKVALDAVLHCRKWAADPAEAWKIAAQAAFPESTSMQRKGCPRSAFLGLCAAGFVRGVPKGNYTRSSLNKAYAIKAAELLRLNKSLAASPAGLWRRVQGRSTFVVHNGQLDVVLALWNRKMLKGS